MLQIVQTLIPLLATPRFPKLSLDTIKSFWIPALVPVAAVCSLFIASTILTEALSAGKYPRYKDYQRRVGMFNPVETILKGVWLCIIGQKAKVDLSVWGDITDKKSE